MLTNKGKYGLKAMTHLAGMPPGQPALVADIAAANSIPKKFLDAILGELRELPFDQIVELLGTSRSAGYKMLHDARRALKQRLHEAGITGEDIQNAFNL